MKKSIATLALALVIASVAAAQTVETYLQGHTDSVNAVVYSPDGRRAVTASDDKTIRIWDAASGRELRTLAGHSDRVGSLAVSPDGKQIASGSNDATIKLWNMETGQEIRTITGHAHTVVSVAFSPDSKRLVSCSVDKTIKIWDAGTGREIRSITTTDYPDHVIYSPNGKYIAYIFTDAQDNGFIKVVDAESGREIRSIKHGTMIDSIAYSPDSSRIASASWIDDENENIKIWNAETGTEIKTLSGIITDGVCSLAFSPNGRQITAGLFWNDIKIWDTESGRELRTITGHSGTVNSVAYSPDNSRILSGSNDSTARIWDAATGRELLSLAKNTVPVYRVALSPNGKRLASGSSDGIIRIWDIENGRMLQAITAHVFNGSNVPVFSLVYSADGRRLLLGGDDDTVKIWDAETGRNIRTIATGAGSAFCASYSPDGKRILSGLQDKTLKIWDAESGRELRTLTGHTNMVWAAAWSPDGKRVVSGSDDKSIKLWDAETGKEIRTMSNNAHGGRVNMLVFSIDGKYIYSGGVNNAIGIWYTDPVTEKDILYGTFSESSPVMAININVNREVVVGLADGSVKVHPYNDRDRIFTKHNGSVNSVAINRYGAIATASDDGTIRIININSLEETGQLIQFKGGEWLCMTSGSYYTASAKGDQMVNARSGNTVSGLDRYRSTYNNDVVVAAVLTLSDAGSNSSGVFSFTTLPPANAKAATAMLGAIAYKDGQATRFLEPANREKISRYEAALQALKTKTGITDTEVQNALRTAIAAEVDAQFNRVEFRLDTQGKGSYNAVLIRNAQNQYVLEYERPSVAGDDKTLSASTLETLLAEIRKNTTDFNPICIDTVRAQAALMPAVVFTRIGKDPRQDIVEILTQFYLNPTNATIYGAVRDVNVFYSVASNISTNQENKAMYGAVALAYGGTLSALSPELWRQVDSDSFGRTSVTALTSDVVSRLQLAPLR